MQQNKKILFINPCLRLNAKRKFPPVGLACILKAVKNAGYEFDLYDMDADNLTVDDLNDFLSGNHYDIFGVGAIVTAFRLIRDIADIIKKHNSDAVVIAGNSVSTSIPEILLKNTKVDIGVMGEGDVTIVELLDSLIKNSMQLSEVDGIVFEENSEIIHTNKRQVIQNLDEIGFPDWEIFNIKKYNEGMVRPVLEEAEESVVFPLNSARGCPFNCTFCYHVFKGDRYRRYSEEAIFNEFKRLYYEFHATYIYFWDELSFPNTQTAERLVMKLEELPFRISWAASSRGDLFSKNDVDLIRKMKSVGCKHINFSIENASPEILQAMNKRINLDKIVEHCDALHEGGLTPFTSIIFGYPQETPESIKMTIDMCDRCRIYPSVGFLQPLPGTPMYEYAKENGFITDEVEYLLQAGDRQDFHINMTKIPSDEFYNMVVDGLKELAAKMGLKFDNPLKTAVYQKPKDAKN